MTLRHEHAWALAREAAALLRTEYGIDRVVVFGSLVRSELFHPRSDVDLVVWGLDEYRGFRHIGRNVFTFNVQPARLKALADGL